MKTASVGKIVFTPLLLILTSIAAAQGEQEKAQTLLAQAQTALGGKARLQGVSGLSLVAHSERLIREPEEQVVAGNVELSFLLPDKFRKESAMAPPGSQGTLTIIEAVNGEQEWSDVKSNGTDALFRRGEEASGVKATLLRERRAEMARLLLPLLLTAPAGLTIEWSYAGKAEDDDGGRSDALDARGTDGFEARLFLDEESHVPLALSYQMKPRVTIAATLPAPPHSGNARRVEPLPAPPLPPLRAKEVEGQIRFAEHQIVNGILLPHRITYATNGEVDEVWAKIKYTVNPTFNSDRFTQKK